MPEGENCTTISPNCGAVQAQGQLVTGGRSRSELEVVELTRLLIDPFDLLPSAWGGCVWREDNNTSRAVLHVATLVSRSDSELRDMMSKARCQPVIDVKYRQQVTCPQANLLVCDKCCGDYNYNFN